MSHFDAEDQPLREVFEALAPEGDRLAAMEARVMAKRAEDARSLAAEWLDLFRVGPVLQAGYAVAAVAGLAVITPLGTLLFAALLL